MARSPFAHSRAGVPRRLVPCALALLAAGLAPAQPALAPPPQDYVLHFLGRHVAVAPATPAFDLGNEFTIEAWVYLVTPGTGLVIVMRPDDPLSSAFGAWTGLMLDWRDGTRVIFVQSSGQPDEFVAAESSAPLRLRTWSHVAGTLKDGVVSLFVNGKLDGTTTSHGPPVASNAPFAVGAWRAGDGSVRGQFFGALRQIRVWSRALRPQELLELAGQTLSGTEPGLLACWPLDDGAGMTARDISPRAATLTIPENQAGGMWFDQPRWWFVGKGGPFFEIDRIDLPQTWLDSNRFHPPIIDSVPIDFDSDGDPDIVAGCSVFDSPDPLPLYALRNDGAGGFADATAEVLGGAAMVGPRDWAVADFNGDGRVDLFIAEQGQDGGEGPYVSKGGQSRMFIQSSDGRLVDETPARLPLAHSFTHNVAAADVDGDSDVDLYLANVCCGDLGPQLLINDGDGHFGPEPLRLPPELRIAPGGGWPGNFSSARFGDINNDGFPELLLGVVTCGPEWPSDILLLNDGRGYFAHARPGAMPPRHGGATWITEGEIAVGDLDRDGWADLLMGTSNCTASEPFVQLLLNNRDGTFRDASERIGQQWTVTERQNGNWIPSTSLADLNGDGWLDFCTIGSQGLHLFISDRGRHFVDVSAILPAPIPAVGRPITLTPGGNPDFFFLGWTDYWYYVARSVKPFSLTGPPRPRRHLTGRQPQ